MFYFCLNVGEHNLDEVTVVSLIMFQNARGLVYTYCHRYKTKCCHVYAFNFVDSTNTFLLFLFYVLRLFFA